MPRLDGEKLPPLEIRHIDGRTIREKDLLDYQNNLSHLYFAPTLLLQPADKSWVGIIISRCVSCKVAYCSFTSFLSLLYFLQKSNPLFPNKCPHYYHHHHHHHLCQQCKSLFDYCTRNQIQVIELSVDWWQSKSTNGDKSRPRIWFNLNCTLVLTFKIRLDCQVQTMEHIHTAICINMHTERGDILGCTTQNILIWGSVRPFSHHWSIPRDVSENPSLQSNEYWEC